MAQEIGLRAVLDDGNFQAGMSRYMSGLRNMTSQTTSSSNGMSQSFLSLGDSVLSTAGAIAKTFGGAALAGAAALTAFTGSAIMDAAALEQQIADIGAVFGAAEFDAEMFKGVILDLGLDPNLKVEATEAAASIEMLARNGLFAGVAMDDMESVAFDATKAVILLQNATGTDFGNAANIATDAMALWGIEADNMIDAVDGIVSVTTSSKFTIDDYSLALRNGGAAAAQMNIPLHEFNAVIAASAEELGTGQKAGTGFSTFITRLTPNTKTATEAMRDLGWIVDGNNIFFDEATGQIKSMDQVAGILNQTFNGTKEVTREVGGRTAEQNRVLGELRSQYNKASQTIADYESGVKGITLSEGDRNAKIQEQQELMAALSPRIEELSAIRGDLVTETVKMTDAERSAALEVIFGADAMKTAIALANEGEPGMLAFMETMLETGVAGSAAGRRMDTLSGAFEVLGGIIDTIKIQIGDAFLPIIRTMVENFSTFVDTHGPKVVAVFQNIAEAITALAMGDFDALKDILPPSMAGMVERLSTAFNGLKTIFMGIREQKPGAIFFGLASMLGLPLKETAELAAALQDGVGRAIDFVRDNFDAFKGAIKGLLAVLGGAGLVSILSTIAGVLGTILSPIGLLIAAAMALGAAWETNFMGIRDIVTEWWENSLRPALETLMLWLMENVPIALETLRAVWVDQVWPAILAAVEFVWPIIQALFQTYVAYITDVFIPTMLSLWEFWVNVLWPGILEVVAVVWPIIQQILLAAQEWFLNVLIPTLQQLFIFWTEVLWPGIQAALVAAWEFILPILTQLGEWILNTLIPTLINLYEQWVNVIWPAITTALQAAWDTMLPIFETLGNWILETLIPTIQQLYDAWVLLIWPEIQRITQEAGAALDEVFTEINRWIQDNIIPIVQELEKVWAKTVWPAIQSAIEGAWIIVKPIFEALNDWMDNTLPTVLKGIQSAFESAWGAIQGAIEGVKGPFDSLDNAIRGFHSWLSGISFDFDFNLPDLPPWAIPGSPIPLHTAWKGFGDYLKREQFRPQVDITDVVSLATPLADTTAPIVNVDGGSSTQNNFNLNMTTTTDEVSLRQTFRLMELASAT